jgi:crotonobetainyl-CoA:carnitine CoA-transferase CaiB-like acyl-CoA transferase
MAHYYREITGEGQQVDVSLQEVAASRTSSDLVVWEFDKRLIKRNSTIRTVGARATRWIWQCKDGYVFWPYMGGPVGAPANRSLSQWMDDDGIENPLNQITNWDEFDMAAIPREVLNIQQEAIAKFFLKRTKKELAEEGLRRRINASVVNNPADVLANQQLEARDFWIDLEQPEMGMTLKYPKFYFLSNQTENFIKRRAPHIGEDNNDIYVSELGLSSKEMASLKESGVI